MTLKSYLWGMKISVIVSFAALILVVWQIDPEKSGALGKLLFYGSAFLFFAGAFVLFFTWSRRVFRKNDENALANIGISFRQGILMSILVVGLLVFQQFRILIWWDGALLIAGVFLIELYFLTKT